MEKNILLKVENLKKYYSVGKSLFSKPKTLKAIDDISFFIKKGETVSLVGESGCGKSTTGKMILKIEEPTAGKIIYDSKDIVGLNKNELKEYRKKVQIIFQDPYSSLNPRWKVGQIIGEPLLLSGQDLGDYKDKILEIMDKVGLLKDHYDRYPHQFSGGQRQRICIARSLILQPELIVCDEPVSALDVSIQSQVLNLLLDLQKEFNLTYLFISHDLSVVNHISDRIIVMYLGKIVETGSAEDIMNNPKHPYTKALLSAVPDLSSAKNREKILLQGDIPTPLNPPKGCRFSTRCPFVKSECSDIDMKLIEVSDGHYTACPFKTF
ncbi:dipeptide ABC transporter ATP-binding protein [Deferribacteraceae bacterium V6Fe1]|jgi:oligopeptide/dipeptide ABC transporter ATP-binding protein|uniref:ABC transporter ATP-binding protein n=1 Tax=Deferrivibrio essentukiensis TaxID=2880922 RepID=UPI001F62612E|nr:dipeptide ABC transporter ATP-binding protein [Deferrivibrio essentukiensis]MCB4203392.1 dipeptide ABC transporter ATP-binding protein [Deferrivibrio essentukiensis]UOD35243.1 dipeptide ABC transporter ATP-binding protein [Deferribacteraceae bacterium V6Fe1]